MTLLRTIARQTQRPDEILARLNSELEAQNPRKMFVTMSCLAFELSTGRVTGASAGHNPLLLIPSTGAPRFVFPSSGMVAGMRPDRSYTSETLDLNPGDTLLLYTDGITDAENVAEEQFESDRILRCFSNGAPRTAKDVLALILGEVRTFATGAAQIDDMTLVAVRFEGVPVTTAETAGVPATAVLQS